MVGLFLTMLSASPSSGDPRDLAAEARHAFEEGLRRSDDPILARTRFRAAVDLYEEIRRTGISNVDLHRSQGNAALLAGDVPRAVLAYRRALRHDPTDHESRQGLARAREETLRKVSGGLGKPPSDDRPPWLPRAGFGWGSFLLCGALYVGGWLMSARWVMTRRTEMLTAGLLCLALSIGATVVLGLASLYEEWADEGTLVVIARDELPLRLGDGESYPSRHRGKLPRGAEAKLIHRRGEWVMIEMSGRETGWVPLSAVLIDQ